MKKGRLKRAPSDDEHDDDEDNDEKHDNAPRPLETPFKKRCKKTQRVEAASSSSSVSTAATSVALTPMSVNSEVATPASHHVELDRRREQLHQQMIVLFVAAVVTAIAIIVAFVPFFLLVGLGTLAVSTGALSYSVYRRLLLEYQQIVSGDGLSSLLPESVNQQLTDMTLHEFLTDNSFPREWGFLALYFIPGLTPEQLEGYLRRLAPDHQEFLQRRGLGNLFGDGFMRALVGDHRWRPRAIEANLSTGEHLNQQQLSSPGSVGIRAIGFDSDDGEGNESHDDDDEGDDSIHVVSDRVPLTFGRFPGWNGDRDGASSIDDDDDEDDEADATTASSEERERQLDMENDLLVSAFFDGAWTYIYTIVGYFNRYAFDRVVEPTSTILARAGVGASFLALGAGYWGIYSGYYHRPELGALRMPTAAGVLPSSRTLWITAIAGGASAAALMYARSAYRPKPSPPSAPDPPKKSRRKR